MTELIADLPIDDRPREKLMMHGAEVLSNAELVAILLGSGTRGKNALQLARELLHDGVAALAKREARELAKIPGVGPAKATRVFAGIELARRSFNTDYVEPPEFDADILGTALVKTCAKFRQERLGAVFLDSRNGIIKQREIFVGTIDHALVSTRDVIRFAVENNASGVALYHNHPSGSPKPSIEDITFTKKMQGSLSLCDIRLIEHLIIGAQGYTSMKVAGHL